MQVSLPESRWARALAVVLVLVLVVVLALVGRAVWERSHRTTFARSLERVPAATRRLAFTDWAAVRAKLGVRDDASPSPASVGRWLTRAYSQDLSAASSIDESARALQRYYGFSPGNARWEAYAQSRQGATMVLRLDDDVDFADLRDNLRRINYRAPARADGVWRGGVDLVASLDGTLTPELQYVVLLADQHLVVSSDTAAYAALAGRVAAGHGAALSEHTDDRAVAASVPEPAAAILWAGDFACTDLAMSQAGADDQSLAQQLIGQAGKVSPLSGLVMALAPDRTLRVAEQFESGDQARANLRARATLAVGQAVGRGEATFADDLRLTGARTSGATVLLTMRPRSSGVYPLSSLYDGPVVFATC
ncbi:MAG: hypothetical protein ACTHNS_12595 [Marmoricola sp.]